MGEILYIAWFVYVVMAVVVFMNVGIAEAVWWPIWALKKVLKDE